jgi:hypothetical protein
MMRADLPLASRPAFVVSGSQRCQLVRFGGYIRAGRHRSGNVDIQFRLGEEIVVGFVMERLSLSGFKVEKFL